MSVRHRTKTNARFRAHRQERREQLLDTATEVVRRLGAGTTMDAIAAEVGVAKPVIYRYFAGRSGLLDALGERSAERLVGTIRKALAANLKPQELLTATIEAYISAVEADPEIYRFLTQRVVGDPTRRDGFVAEVSGAVASVLGEQLRAAGRDSGPAEAWAFGIVGMVHLSADWWLDRRTMPRARLVQYLTDLLWKGLQAHSLSAAKSDRRTK